MVWSVAAFAFLLARASAVCSPGAEGDCEADVPESALLQLNKDVRLVPLAAAQRIAAVPVTSCALQVHEKLSEMRKHYAAMQVPSTIAKISLLQHSETKVFPLELVETVEFGSVGNTSYLGILLPNYSAIETFYPYSQDALSFLASWQVDFDCRIAAFRVASGHLQSDLTGATVHASLTEVAEEVNRAEATNSLPFVQGGSGAWREDSFAGQFIGHTFLASLLEPVASGDAEAGRTKWVLDLTDSGTATTPVQVMKRKAVAQVPSVLLKARGFLTSGDDGPKLVEVEVQDPRADNTWYSFKPTSGVQWELAKMVLLAEALYVIQCFHTGIHLFSGAAVSAIKKSIPAGSTIGNSVKPQTVLTIFALFEEAASLHANHDSAFDGKVWQTDNITQVWETTRDIARYYLENTPEDFLGLTAASPDWWAGMSSSFIAPIEQFAEATANDFVEHAQEHLHHFQTELAAVGLLTSASSLDVTGVAGFAKFLSNLLFVAGICHTHMYSTREFFTPLVGWVSTIELLPYLTGQEEAPGLGGVLSAAFPSVLDPLLSGFNLMYDTASGFSRKNGAAPQLGDGPYHTSSDALQRAVSTFQASLASTREAVYEKFGGFPQAHGSWSPGYFYPEETEVPFGFGITQTTYI